jgi:hypothetical protein
MFPPCGLPTLPLCLRSAIIAATFDMNSIVIGSLSHGSARTRNFSLGRRQ